MEDRSIPAAPSDMSEKYEQAIRKKLDALLRTNHYSQTQFCQMLRERGLALEQGNLSSMLKGRKHIPLSLIVQICDIFSISLADLVDESFGGAKQASAQMPPLYADDLLNQVPSLGDSFITNPTSVEFQGYLQTYHFYTLPTQSDETKLSTGTITLEPCGPICEARLDLNTGKIANGKPLQKHYKGRVIISTAIDAVYILLASPIEGDFSIISFRHFHLPHQPLDCRIAAVLTNEPGEFHSPTMHRMFLSRTPIQPEHLPLVLPHLQLNTGSITIQKEKFDRLMRNAPEYANLMNTLTMIPPAETYHWTEDYVVGVAKLFLNKEDIPLFLTQIRQISDHSTFNKASRRANSLVRNLLLALGYYHDHDLQY